jgi:hypothetical protein
MEDLAGIAHFTGATGGLSIVGRSADAQASDAVWYAWSSDFLGHPASNLFRRGLGHPPGGVALQRPASPGTATWHCSPWPATERCGTGGWSQWTPLLHPARAFGLHEDDRVVVDHAWGDDSGQLVESAVVDGVEQPLQTAAGTPDGGVLVERLGHWPAGTTARSQRRALSPVSGLGRVGELRQINAHLFKSSQAHYVNSDPYRAA